MVLMDEDIKAMSCEGPILVPVFLFPDVQTVPGTSYLSAFEKESLSKYMYFFFLHKL